MRLRYAAVLAVLLALSGCSIGYAPGSGFPTATSTSTATPEGPTPTATPTETTPDPETDVLGWESGYWANATLTLDRSDGLNESERQKVVARAMARVELTRNIEFDSRVPVELLSREEFRNSSIAGSSNVSDTFRTFDNAKFEALFLVGESDGSLEQQESNRGSSVAGFYSPRRDEIVVIYGGDTPDLPGEGTLAHELTHAAQDQEFDLTSITAQSREESNANNGLIEGDANLVQDRYMANCGEKWSCLSPPQTGSGGGSGGGSNLHIGIYAMNFFPYADGPGFVEFYEQRGGWERVNKMFDNVPASTEQVIYPEKYAITPDPPTNVSLTDTNTNGWNRVRPERRPADAHLGQSAMAAMFGYTLYDSYNSNSVIAPRDFLNYQDGSIVSEDPFNYDIAPVDGWDGDRLHIYQKDGEVGYVWRSVWDADADAREFANAYVRLLNHWGGTQVSQNTYVVRDSPFADAFYITVKGDTVTIVNAPTKADLTDVRA